jgi:hypothetical protein
MKRAIFFVLASLIEASLFSQNLVQNPGFDNWGVTGKPIKWTNSAGCVKDSLIVNSAPYSCRQISTISSAKELGQKIPVEASKKYTLSFYYNTDTTTKGSGCRIWCEWQDSIGELVDSSSLSILHSSTMKSEIWKQFSVEATAPEGAVTFYLLVRTMSRSITYWDNFVFEEAVLTSRAEELLTGIKVHPNPASNYLIISNLYDMQHINIQNLAGMIVWSGDFAGEMTVTIPVSELRNGMYILRITASGKQFTRKFIKLTN